MSSHYKVQALSSQRLHRTARDARRRERGSAFGPQADFTVRKEPFGLRYRSLASSPSALSLSRGQAELAFPFALSLSKGLAEPVEAFFPNAKVAPNTAELPR